MSVLAIPENSQLLLINPVQNCLDHMHIDLAKQISERFQRLTAAADQARVPRYFAVSGNKDERKAWLSEPCEKRHLRVYEFAYDRPVWSNEELLNALRSENREQLFVCGFWLDDVVTATALEAQPFGFNTHVIVDLSHTHGHLQRQPSLDRLNQYGIVPISLKNLLYEWMAKTSDDVCRKELEVFWKQEKSS